MEYERAKARVAAWEEAERERERKRQEEEAAEAAEKKAERERERKAAEERLARYERDRKGKAKVVEKDWLIENGWGAGKLEEEMAVWMWKWVEKNLTNFSQIGLILWAKREKKD